MDYFKKIERSVTISADKRSTVDLQVDVWSQDLNVTKFILKLDTTDSAAIDLTNATVRVAMVYSQDGKDVKIEAAGIVEDVATQKIAYVMDDKLAGFEGTVIAGFYVTLSTGQRIDIQNVTFNMRKSLLDKDLEAAKESYYQTFDDIVADVQSKGEKSKTDINAVVSDVNDYADSQKQAIHNIVDDVQSVGDTAKEDIKATLPSIQAEVSEIKEDIVSLEEKCENILDSDNLIKDRLYKTVVESWSENTGWYYNWDGTTTKEISQSKDVTYKGFPTLHVKLSNASGYSKWVGTKEADFVGKTVYIECSYYIANDSVERVQLFAGSKQLFNNTSDLSIGWHRASGYLTISSDDTNKIVRFSVTGNADIYFAPLLMREKSSFVGLTVSDTMHNISESKVFDSVDYSKELILPEIFPCVNGMEMDLYFDNLLSEKDVEDIHNLKFDRAYNYNCTVLKNYLAWNPTEDSGFGNKFSVSFDGNDFSNEDLIKRNTFVSYSKTSGSGKNATCLFIGDSLTNYGGFISELYKNFSDDSVTFESIGTRTANYNDSSGQGRAVKHEGRPGWRSDHYCTQATVSNIDNPFYNPDTSKFDFNYYMTNNAVGTPNYVFIMLGTNDLGYLSVDNIVSNFETMIQSIHAYDSNIVVFVNMCIPNYQYAYGDTKTRRKKRHYLYLALQDKWSYQYNKNNVILLPMFMNFDAVNDFGTDKKYSYLHNNVEKVVTDDTHPNNTGYFKMGNTIYYFLKYWIAKSVN